MTHHALIAALLIIGAAVSLGNLVRPHEFLTVIVLVATILALAIWLA